MSPVPHVRFISQCRYHPSELAGADYQQLRRVGQLPESSQQVGYPFCLGQLPHVADEERVLHAQFGSQRLGIAPVEDIAVNAERHQLDASPVALPGEHIRLLPAIGKDAVKTPEAVPLEIAEWKWPLPEDVLRLPAAGLRIWRMFLTGPQRLPRTEIARLPDDVHDVRAKLANHRVDARRESQWRAVSLFRQLLEDRADLCHLIRAGIVAARFKLSPP